MEKKKTSNNEHEAQTRADEIIPHEGQAEQSSLLDVVIHGFKRSKKPFKGQVIQGKRRKKDSNGGSKI